MKTTVCSAFITLSSFSIFLGIGAEGGADQWARPPCPRIDEKKDSISTSTA